MKKAQRQTLTAPIRRVRFVYVALFLSAWVAVIVVRLAWLQVVRHAEFVEKANQQQQRTFEVAPRRGVLYDRNMRELAMTVLVDSVYAVPSELGDNKASDAALLAKIVHLDTADRFTTEEQIQARLDGSRNFAWVARKLDPDTVERVSELNLKGIYLQKEFKRFYPNGDLAAQVLGYVGTDDNGLGGMESKFEPQLHGAPGHMLTAIDAKRHVLGSEERDPLPGQSLELTIDSNIQYMAERALDAQMAKVKALHGTVVVQDPRTGQILALAVSPRFNPNDSRHLDPDSLTNRAVSDVYEPGSTFKLVTYSAAIDAAGVEPTDIVDCQGGTITLFGRTIHDDKSDMGMGRVTVQRALEKSSDVAAVKMALKVGPEKFYSYMKACDWAGGGCHAGATGVNGLQHRQWRGVHAAAHSAAVRGRDKVQSGVAGRALPSGLSVAGRPARRSAPCDLGDDGREDARDDAGHCGGRHRPASAVEWLQLGRQDRYGAEV